ncbi:FAD-dependent oxidoreductase [Gordonia sp. PP30]|uniref:NAD(P)/FAD-dependent oxidoreductase n=1 Tax=unclassified Gordonia (in: high G+C Gram-positive bacteria) TaxID=2657482 RepID=UPI001FFFA9E9|nr:FAD-dependent oxidoreductase [Gordonia sp. PP30]UQE73764.1 FAD-dependent oxidoreductase [Gordonia sp. PP30]
MTFRSLAVVGSGVAGLAAAHVLAEAHPVTLFEADDRLGGHAHTHLVTTPSGTELAVDTGFIVHNDRTYPTLQRLLAELGVRTQDTDMSMSVRSEITGLEYAGARGLTGLFPTAANVARPRYVRMLAEIRRFHRAARRTLDTGDARESLAGFVDRERFSGYFRQNFLYPLVAAVWSCDPDTAAHYPARYLFTFLHHHGMLSVFGSPTWRTVVGGSVSYVDALASGVAARGEVRVSSPVRAVRETDAGVEVVSEREGSTRTETFDAVVVATHPHQALALLARPTTRQREILGAMPYLRKHAVLHTDESVLPRARRARASWNYQVRDEVLRPGADAAPSPIVVTYDLTRLMRLPTDEPRMLVTMGRTDVVDPRTILDEMTYEHPVYTLDSVAAQARLSELDTDRVVFAGAYHGWGFHEDGAASGVRAARALGVDWSAPAPSEEDR